MLPLHSETAETVTNKLCTVTQLYNHDTGNFYQSHQHYILLQT